MKNSREDIKPILKKYAKALKSKENVLGCGIAKKKIKGRPQDYLSVTVFVEKKMLREQLNDEDIIPKQLDGIETDVIETGKIEAQICPKDRYRPFFGGISCGRSGVSAGTIGLPAVKTNKYEEDKLVLLSNAHVIAPHWSTDVAKGDDVIQPGIADEGWGGPDTVAALLDWKEIKFGEDDENEIDAAIAECTEDADTYVLGIGNYLSLAEEPEIDMSVTKHGRTTGHTEGIIVATDAEVDVNFDGGAATFIDQIIIEGEPSGSFSDGGDSGSAIFVGTKNEPSSEIVGLLFAGSDSFTIANDINKVFEEFDLELLQDVPEFIRGEEMVPEEEGSKVYKSAGGHKNWKDDYLLEIRAGSRRVYP